MLNINEAYYYREFRNVVSDLKIDKGVVVASVEDGSPAAKAKLKQGDVITKVDDESCKSIAYLRYVLYKHEVGDKIKIAKALDDLGVDFICKEMAKLPDWADGLLLVADGFESEFYKKE